MNNSLPLLDSIISNLKTLTKDVIVKYSSKASEKESIAYIKAFDYFHLASTKQDTFDTYPSFCEEALRKSGINVDKELSDCIKDKNNINEGLRNRVVENQRAIVIRDFEEQNDYYRQYIGLPDLEDTEYFYVPQDISDETGISTDVPVHKLSLVDLSILNGMGYISKLIEENPKKVYLNFLGTNRLDLYRIRTANNLSIIKINKLAIPDKLFEEFMTCYEQSRTYFMNAIFIKEYAAVHEYYENMMGFLVMVNTIKMVMTKIFKNGIDRDFYDLFSIVKMFEAYNIPYIKEFSLEQQRTILRNINKLIRLKSTDKVLVEICNLLGLGDIDIYRYYLVKSHKLDEGTGKPIFKYKENHFKQKVLDKEAMYNVRFAKVDIKETNIGLALTKTKNHLDYHEVTESDPFWWEDDDLKKSIYENEFNFIETKYISFQLMYKMSKVIFEQIYFLSMLHDRKDETSKIKLLFPKISFSDEVSLFDACILLFALTCKKNKMKGEILYSPTKVGSVLGFNFKVDLKPILDDIKNDKRIYDEELIDYITGMSLSSVEDVNKLYSKITGFRKYIEEKMFFCTDKDVYAKYKTIYNTFMTTDTMGELFKLPDGDIASTYKEYLMYNNYELYQLIDTVPENAIMDLINHIIAKMEEYCTNLQYLHLTGANLDSTINAIWTLVNFFKSYTVDIQQFNIIYLVDGRIENMLKLIDYATINVNNSLEDNMQKMHDTLSLSSDIVTSSDFKFICRSQYYSYIGLDDRLVISTLGEDVIKIIKSRVNVSGEIDTFDTLQCSDICITYDEKLNIEDKYKYFIHLSQSDRFRLTDKIKFTQTHDIHEILKLEENVKAIVRIFETDSLKINSDLASYTGTIYCTDESINLEEVVTSELRFRVDDEMVKLYDSLISHNNIECKSDICMTDKIKIVYN